MSIIKTARELILDCLKVCLRLYKVMIPIIILVKILKETGLIVYFAIPLGPVMELVGLPAKTGLVWATAILNNLYGAIVVYLALMPDMPTLTVAQVTILSTMMLIAHGLPIEAKITQECGASFWGQVVIRLVAAFLCGVVMNLVFSGFGLLTQPSVVIWKADAEASGILAWIWSETINLGAIFCIVLSLMAMMKLLNYLRITELFIKILGPVLRVIGVGRNAATITIFGLTMGIVYGGGLIIHEARSGALTRQDIFAAATLMGLSHALIEDTLLMMLIGADFNGVFWGRLLFSLAAMAILTRIVFRKPDSGAA